MTREDIIRMAREANIKQAIETPHLLMVHELERFAALVAAAEREACAKTVESIPLFAVGDMRKFEKATLEDAAAQIRKRGETK